MAEKKLTAAAVAKVKKPGLLNDGGGLYLRIKEGGTRSWILRFKRNGRTRDMGLGGYPGITLADARDKAAAVRKLLVAGLDPIEAKAVEARNSETFGEASASDRPADNGANITFEMAAERFIAGKEAAWRNPKTPYRWRARLRDYAFPTIGKMGVAEIAPDDVFRCLRPIWYEKPETASKTRGYIEAVLSWAGVQGHREKTQNPAAWKGNLEHLLTARKGFEIVEHHPAMPYAELPAFMVELRGRDALAARALEFIILTACRSGDARGAPWSEIFLDKAEWTIPATRQLKSRRVHRVPLASQAVALLKGLPRLNTFVFPGARDGKPFSDMAFNMLLRRMGVADFHTHGFRSTFKDWCVEQTNYPAAISEMALAHDIGTGTEKAYRRSDFFDKRRELMQAWADFCTSACPAEEAPDPIEDNDEIVPKPSPADRRLAQQFFDGLKKKSRRRSALSVSRR